MIKISYSRVSCYLDCPQKHHFSYIQCLRSKKPARPLSFGSDFHKLLEFRNNPNQLQQAFKEIENDYYELNPMFQSDLGENYLEDLKTVFSDYIEVYGDSEKPLKTEHEFLVQIGSLKGQPVYFHGIIDEIYENLVMGEHKTFTTAPSMDTLAMNMQVCLYSKAWELETGEKLQRVRWDYIKSTPSTYPIWLDKSKRFSEAKSEKITPMSWLRACKELNITDKEVLDKSKNYSQNVSNFFFKCDMEILPVMVDTVWRDFKYVCKEVILKGDTNKVKNISRNCSWCNYRPICYAEFTGNDVEYVKSTDFIVKER